MTSTLTPYIAVSDAAAAIAFYQNAFGAKEVLRLEDPSGKVAHAEIEIGGARLMLSDEFPDYDAVSPKTLGGAPVKLHLVVADADEAAARAVEAGATLARPVADAFHGERSGLVTDPFGFSWFVSSRLEDLEPAEIERRWADQLKG